MTVKTASGALYNNISKT